MYTARTKLSVFICMLLILTLFVQDFAECSSRGMIKSLEVLHRQSSLEMKKMALKNGARLKLSSYGNNELKRIPSGPNPLHHNGQDPKKPETP